MTREEAMTFSLSELRRDMTELERMKRSTLAEDHRGSLETYNRQLAAFPALLDIAEAAMKYVEKAERMTSASLGNEGEFQIVKNMYEDLVVAVEEVEP